jgi:hypothetical protein
MKALTTALTLATIILALAFIQSANAAPQNRRDAGQGAQTSEGTYGGYPLREWLREDSW